MTMPDSHSTPAYSDPGGYTAEQERAIDAAIVSRAGDLESELRSDYERMREVALETLALVIREPLPKELQRQILSDAQECVGNLCMAGIAANVMRHYYCAQVDIEIARQCEAEATKELDLGKIEVEGVNDE